MSYHIENGLNYEINDNNTEATLLGFATSSIAINNIPKMTIPDFVRGVPVTTIGIRAFEKVDELESVILPSTLKTIQSCAFLGCQHLETVSMSCKKAKKSELTICSSAFAYCFSLMEVDVTCKLNVEDRAFYACDKLNTIHGAITSLKECAFKDCNRIQLLRFQNDASVKYDAFYESTITNIECLGNVVFSQNDIKTLLDCGTTLYCPSNSNIVELAYEGINVICDKFS